MSVIANLLRDIKALLGGSSGGGATADGQNTGNASLASIDSKTPALISGSVPVYVTNQLDITTISSYLLDIKNSCADIDANTDAVESKLDDVVTAINANGTVNHNDLLVVIAELQAVDANTAQQETLLTNILNKLITAPATEAKQEELLAAINDGVLVYDPTKNTYVATFKATARPYSLSHNFLANTRKQFATVWHSATSTKTLKLRRVELIIRDSSGTAIVSADLVRITSQPASGNPAITPSSNLSNAPAADAVCLSLPTTAGTAAAQFGALEIELGNTGGAPTTNPPPLPSVITLYADTAHEAEPLTMRAGVGEGFAVVLDSNAVVTILAIVRMVFTEE